MVRFIFGRPLQPPFIVNVTADDPDETSFRALRQGRDLLDLDLYPRDPHTLIPN